MSKSTASTNEPELDRYHYVECPELETGAIYDIENEKAWIESNIVIELG